MAVAFRVGLRPTPAREKRQRGTSSRPTRPFSRPHARADRRKTAALFASSPGVQCRDRLPAGAKWIRTPRVIFWQLIATETRRPRQGVPRVIGNSLAGPLQPPQHLEIGVSGGRDEIVIGN